MIEIPVPVRLAFKIAALDQNAIGARPWEGRHAAAARLICHLEWPAAPCMGVIVTISAQWPQLEIHGAGGLPKQESDVGGVASVSHPQALLEAGIPTGIGPYRQAIVIVKGAQELKAAWADGAPHE